MLPDWAARPVLDTLAEAVTVQNSEALIYANDAAAALLGFDSAADVVEERPGELAALFTITDEVGQPVVESSFPGNQLLAGKDEVEPLLTRSFRRDTATEFWLLTKARLLEGPDGERLAVNVIEDVTEAKATERRYRFLSEAGEVLSSSLDYEETLRRVARLAVPRLADWCVVDVPDEYGQMEQVAVAHVDRTKVEAARTLRERFPPRADSPTGAAAVLRTGKSQLFAEITDEVLATIAQNDEHLALLRDLGMRSGMAVPMRSAGGGTVGVITFVSGSTNRRLDAGDVAFAEDVARRAGIAVENARLYTERSRVAQTLQSTLLPDALPTIAGWDLSSSYQAGERGSAVGGDFYDVVEVPRGIFVVLGDVTGKGVQAATLTAQVRYSARTAALFDPCPAAILDILNRMLRSTQELAPVTMACGFIDLTGEAPELTFASAGHPSSLLRSADGSVRALGTGDVLLGAVDEHAYATISLPLSPGDLLLLYTDGVTETEGESDRFGEHRLTETLATAPTAAPAVLATISQTLNAFEITGVADDRAMLALRFIG